MCQVWDGGEDDAAALLEDRKDGSSNGSDHGDGDGHEDGSSTESDAQRKVEIGPRAVQLLSIRANFCIAGINGFDWRTYQCIYRAQEGEVQEVHTSYHMLYASYMLYIYIVIN